MVISSKKGYKIALKGQEWINHFGISIFLMLVGLAQAAFVLYDHAGRFLNGTSTANLRDLAAILGPIALSVLSYFVQQKRLKFKPYNFALTDQEFADVVRATAIELYWRKRSLSEDLAVYTCFQHWVPMRITVLKTDNRLLVNSICNPAIQPAFVSYGWNEKNVQTLLKNVQAMKKGDQVLLSARSRKERRKAKGGGWSFQSRYDRLSGFLLRVLFVVLAVFMFNHGDPKEIRLAISIVLFVGMYLWSDIKMLQQQLRSFGTAN